MVFLSLVPLNSHGQTKQSMTEIDTKTYGQYLNGEWEELIKTGKEAIRSGIEFYYLDVRMGIAYYKLSKYRSAIKYLMKSYQANQKNDYVAELLYYSYLYAGRPMDAQKLKKVLNSNIKEKLKITHDPFVDAISFDYRFEVNDDYKIDPSGNELLTQSVRTGYQFFSIGVEHLNGPNSIYYNYGRVIKKNNIFYPDWSFPPFYSQISEKQEVFQNQIYFNYGNQLSYGLNLSFAFNWLNLAISSELYPQKTFYNYVVGFMALRKDFQNFKAGLFTSVSNLSSYFQFQPGAELTWYPFSNTNLYLYSNFSYKIEQENGISYNEFYFKPAIGVRILSFYIEPAYTFGNIHNSVEADALIVNNDNDIIKDRFDLLTYGYFFKGKLNLFFKYQHFNKVNTYQLNDVEHNITYKNNAYTFGINWRF
jgi:hypothetical protein